MSKSTDKDHILPVAHSGEPSPLFTTSIKDPPKVMKVIFDTGVTKGTEPLWLLFFLAFMAGCFAGLGGLFALSAAGGFTGPGSLGAANPSLPKVIVGMTFPVALFLIIVMKAELFTGNCMYLIVPVIEGKLPLWRLLRSWTFSFFGNFCGALFLTYVLGYKTEILHHAPYQAYTIAVAEKKIHLTFLQAFLRAIGCNWLVCAAIFMGMSGTNLVDKIIAMWWPIFAFATIGFEHCVANMFFVPMGMLEGADITVNQFAYKLLAVTLGNIIGGCVFMGMVEWVMCNSDRINQRYEHVGHEFAENLRDRMVRFHQHMPRYSHKKNDDHHEPEERPRSGTPIEQPRTPGKHEALEASMI